MDPKAYRMILFDQRGCGKSKPAGELKVLNYAVYSTCIARLIDLGHNIVAWHILYV